jgi:hypothetical protein
VHENQAKLRGEEETKEYKEFQQMNELDKFSIFKNVRKNEADCKETDVCEDQSHVHLLTAKRAEVRAEQRKKGLVHDLCREEKGECIKKEGMAGLDK